MGDGLGEGGEGAAQRRALPVEDAHGEQRHAGPLALEGQVQPRLPQLLQAQPFDVGALVVAAQVVGRHRGHFDVGVLHPGRVRGRGFVPLRLVVVQVEGLSAVALVESGTVHHAEPAETVRQGSAGARPPRPRSPSSPDLHVERRRRAPRDPSRPQPIGGRAVRRADLVRPNAVGLVVQAADLVPLRTDGESYGCSRRRHSRSAIVRFAVRT